MAAANSRGSFEIAEPIFRCRHGPSNGDAVVELTDMRHTVVINHILSGGAPVIPFHPLASFQIKKAIRPGNAPLVGTSD